MGHDHPHKGRSHGAGKRALKAALLMVEAVTRPGMSDLRIVQQLGAFPVSSPEE